MRRLMLDTNIVIDYLARREPFYADARLVMLLGALGEAELWVSPSQFNDIFYIATEGGQKSASVAAQERLRRLRSFLHICPMGEADIDAALDSGWADLEDATVHRCACSLCVDYLLTRDATGFADSSVPVASAAELREALRGEGLAYEEIYFGGKPSGTAVPPDAAEPVEEMSAAVDASTPPATTEGFAGRSSSSSS